MENSKQPTQNTLHFIHGSGATPSDPQNFSLQLFDYLYDAGKKEANHQSVRSGLDSRGPGIYAFGAKSADKINKTKQTYVDEYSGEQGSVIAFQVNMEGRDGKPLKLINQYRADTIPAGDWARVIDSFAEKVRALQGFDRDKAQSLAEDFAAHWPDMMQIFADGTQKMTNEGDLAWQSILSATGGLIDGQACPNKYREPARFIKEFEEYLSIDDPMAGIEAEGGSYELASRVIDSSDDLWDTLKNIFSTVAVQRQTGNEYLTMNKLFQLTVLNELPQSDLLKVAAVNNGHFFVVFDTEAIRIQAMQIHRLQPKTNEDAVEQALSAIAVYPSVKEKIAALQAWVTDNTGHALSKEHAKMLAENPDVARSKAGSIGYDLRVEYQHYEAYPGALDDYMPTLKKQDAAMVPSAPLDVLLSRMDPQWKTELQHHATSGAEVHELQKHILGAEVTMSWCEGRSAEVSLRSPVQLSPVCLTQGNNGQPLLRAWMDIEPSRAQICLDIEKMVVALNFEPGRQSLEQLAETIHERHGDDGLWVLGAYFVATDSEHVFQNGVHCYDLAQLSAARVEHRPISFTPLGQSISAKMGINHWDHSLLRKKILELPQRTQSIRAALSTDDAAVVRQQAMAPRR